MSTAAATADQWGRRRLVRTLVVVAMAALLLLGGLVYAVYSAVASTRTTTAAPAAAAQAAAQLPPGPARRDAIAAAAMLAVPPEASRSGTPSARQSLTLTLPPAGKVGPADVPTGFPQTPEGAIGQLAAIETTVLQGMSIDRAHQVHAAWSTTNAVPVEAWELTGNIQAFLSSGAGGQYADSLHAAVVATPVAAQVKGVDGTDWVLACVLLDVKAQISTQARIAYGHCERMQWTDQDGGRWVIGDGPAPARAPSTWPGTDLAAQAGWKTLTSPADQ